MPAPGSNGVPCLVANQNLIVKRLRCERLKISIFIMPPLTPGIFRARKFRDRVLRRCLKAFIRDRFVLELGCGEGHLTEAVLGGARSVVGIDISDVAIGSRPVAGIGQMPRFGQAGDLLRDLLRGLTRPSRTIECIHYLSPPERGMFLEKVMRENTAGQLLLLSGPIVDYSALLQSQAIDARGHGLLGFTPDPVL